MTTRKGLVPACKVVWKPVLYSCMGRRRIGIIQVVLLCLICTSILRAQPFQDLDFEAANLVSIPSDTLSRVYLSAALPGWSGFAGTNQLNAVMYDNFALGSANISILDSNFSGGVIQGNYTVLLQAGLWSGTDVNVSLSQTGAVPAGVKSLSFLGSLAFTSTSFTVSLGGTTLNLISFPVTNKNYSFYQADISEFAGLTADLEFSALAQSPPGFDCWLSLDSIQFSPEAVPEPSASSLLLIGVAGLGILRLTKRKTG